MKDAEIDGLSGSAEAGGPEAPSPRAQARAAAHLKSAIAAIDASFGDGYAAANPQLVASLVQAASIESAISTARELHDSALMTATRISRETNETILRLKPRLF